MEESEQGAALDRHGELLVRNLDEDAAIGGTREIKHSESDTVWAELPNGPDKRTLAQTSVRAAADLSKEVTHYMSDRDTRTDAPNPATKAYELLKKVFPEILTWGLTGPQIDQYLNITQAERNELNQLWQFMDTNRQVMVDLQNYLNAMPDATVQSPVDVTTPSPMAGVANDPGGRGRRGRR